MKKILCLILVLILAIGVMVACGNNDTKTQKTEEDIVTAYDEKADNKEETPIPDGTLKKEDVTPKKEAETTKDTAKSPEVKNDTSSDFYLILNGTSEESILYHIVGCPLLKDKEIQKTSWEMIEMLQFRHCAKCNPPKYKGYVE